MAARRVVLLNATATGETAVADATMGTGLFAPRLVQFVNQVLAGAGDGSLRGLVTWVAGTFQREAVSASNWRDFVGTAIPYDQAAGTMVIEGR